MSKGAYIGVPKPEYEPEFANNSWAQIIKACQKNEVPSTWEVGNQKAMTINGAEYLIDIIGENHDTYADGSGVAPLTFQLHDCYKTKYEMDTSLNGNASGWANCLMRKTNLPAILALMPAEVQAGIKEVNKLTSVGNQTSTINTTADKLFLLSEIEVIGNASESFSGEGSQYAYYAAGNSKIKNLDGSASAWHLRSPWGGNQTSYCVVTTSGAAYAANSGNLSGVAFAFCFGGDSEANNVYGGYSVARKVKKGYIGVDGLARKIKKAYIGIGGVAKLCWASADPVFANNSWAEIIAACQANSVPDEWAVGDSKIMTINGTDFQIDIIGKDHDTYSDGSGTAPLTFQLHDCYWANYQMHYSQWMDVGWSGCEMRTLHLPYILTKMPPEIQTGIKEVNKLTESGGNSSTIASTADKLFLLSEYEVFGRNDFSYQGEGKQYAYYSDGNSKVKKIDGSAYNWWERSPVGTGNYCYVSATGGASRTAGDTSYGVAFAFCF